MQFSYMQEITSIHQRCIHTVSKRSQKKRHTQEMLQKLQTYRLLTKIFSNKVSIDIDVALAKQEDCLSNVALQVQKQPNHLLRQDMLRDETVQKF